MVSGGDDDEAGEDSGSGGPGESRSSSPSVADYLMHCLTIFWKVLFAFVPPTGKHFDLSSLIKYLLCKPLGIFHSFPV